MGTVILACQTLRDEIRTAIRKTGVNYPVFYVESGLHDTPDFLRQRIQDEINRIDNVNVVLLAFGYCGSSLLGIKSAKAKLVLPRADDCIPLLLGSCDEQRRISKEMGTYFLTKGWLDYENNLLREYGRCIERFGQFSALRVMNIIIGNYKRIMVIDTGAYAIDSVLQRTQDFAGKLGMYHEVVSGSPRMLHKLLQGPWDNEFVTLERGQELMINDMCGNGNNFGGVSQLTVRTDSRK